MVSLERLKPCVFNGNNGKLGAKVWMKQRYHW